MFLIIASLMDALPYTIEIHTSDREIQKEQTPQTHITKDVKQVKEMLMMNSRKRKRTQVFFT